MGGGKGGGGGSNVNVEPSPYETAMAGIAQDLYKDTAGLRGGFLRDYGQLLGVQTGGTGTGTGTTSGFLGGLTGTGTNQDYTLGEPNYDITELPTYKPLFGLAKQSLESQYQNAKKTVMGSVPRGGNLAGSLTGLEASRAATMGAVPAELSSSILTDMLNKAYGAAFQTPTTTLSGLGSAAGTYGNRQAAAMAQSAADQQSSYGLLGNLGMAVGSGVGKAIGGK